MKSTDMSDELQLYFNFWTEEFLRQGLWGRDQDPEFESYMREFGALLRDRASRNPEEHPDLAGQDSDGDPIIYAQAALKPVVAKRRSDPGPETKTAAAKGVAAGVKAVAEAAKKAAEKETPPKDGSPPKEETVLDQARWEISLILKRVKCVKETSGFLGTDAGKDDAIFTGSYSYGQLGSKPLLYNYKGKFDSGDAHPAAMGGDMKRLIAKETILESQDFMDFRANLLLLEDDGLSAADASALAKIIGGMSTLLTNFFFSTVQVQTGVSLPPDLKKAYDNYGLPGLIGMLAKAMGPEAFVPISIICRTKLKPNTPTARPHWRARIPDVTGALAVKQGSGEHSGTIELLEGEIEDATLPDGTEVYRMTGALDEGKYQVDLKFKVTQI